MKQETKALDPFVAGAELAAQNNMELETMSHQWGASESLDTNDLLIGKILQQQALSKFVEAGNATPGDWCDSLTGEILAKKDKPLSVIIFQSNKKLLISEGFRGDKLKFVEAQDVTPANVNLPWEEERDGKLIKRNLQYNFFCLIPEKINELPYVVSFTSTKIKAAKKLSTMIAKLARMHKPSAAVIFNLSSVKETRDKGSFLGVEVQQYRATSQEEMKTAFYWYNQMKQGVVPKTTEAAEPVEVYSDEYF